MVAALPPYVATVQLVTSADLPYSWHRGCPVGPSQLRTIRLRYVGFDGKTHTGVLIVNERVVSNVISVFRQL